MDLDPALCVALLCCPFVYAALSMHPMDCRRPADPMDCCPVDPMDSGSKPTAVCSEQQEPTIQLQVRERIPAGEGKHPQIRKSTQGHCCISVRAVRWATPPAAYLEYTPFATHTNPFHLPTSTAPPVTLSCFLSRISFRPCEGRSHACLAPLLQLQSTPSVVAGVLSSNIFLFPVRLQGQLLVSQPALGSSSSTDFEAVWLLAVPPSPSNGRPTTSVFRLLGGQPLDGRGKDTKPGDTLQLVGREVLYFGLMHIH